MNTKREHAVLDAVARHVSATWEKSANSSGAYLIIRGKRVAIDVVTIAHKTGEQPAKPHLRFDKVVLRMMADLKAALAESVPEGQTLIVTCTAPIRLASKTTAHIVETVQSHFARRSKKIDIDDVVFGNAIRVRLVRTLSTRQPKLIGFVHNPRTDAVSLLDLTRDALRRIGAAADRRLPKSFAGERWLVIADAAGASQLEVWRHICSQIPPSAGFARIMIVSGGDRIAPLAG